MKKLTAYVLAVLVFVFFICGFYVVLLSAVPVFFFYCGIDFKRRGNNKWAYICFFIGVIILFLMSKELTNYILFTEFDIKAYYIGTVGMCFLFVLIGYLAYGFNEYLYFKELYEKKCKEYDELFDRYSALQRYQDNSGR